MPIPFAVHRVIVHPLRREGAYASDARLRRSHFIVSCVWGLLDIFDVNFGGEFTVLEAGFGSEVEGSVILERHC